MADDKEFLIRVKADIKQAASDLRKVTGDIKKTGDSSGAADKKVKGLGTSFGFLRSAVAGYLSFQTARKVLQQADAYNVLQQRIKTATKSTGDYAQVSKELYDISQRNGTQLNTTVSLFQNLARAAPELKATNDEMLSLTNAVQQLGVISGTPTANLNAGLLQFSQGLSAGVFRAEEFNSILENIPEVATRIAKGMNLTVGELRNAVLDGKILSKDVFDALVKQAPEIAAEFKDIPVSLDRASTRLGTTFTQLVSKLDKILGLTNNISEGFIFWSEVLDGDPLKEQREKLNLYTKQLKNTEDRITKLQDLLAKGDDASMLETLKAYGEFGGIRINTPEKIEAFIEKLQKQSEEIRANMQAMIDDVTSAGDQPTPDDSPTATAPTEAEKDAQKKIEAITQALQDQAATYGQNAEQIALYKLELLGANKAQFDLAKSAIESIDAQKKAAELQREVADIVKETKTEYEQLAESWARLDELLELGEENGGITWEVYSRAVLQLTEDLDKLKEKGTESMEGLEAAARGWGAEFTNTLAEMVQKGKLDFSSLADSIISDLLRIQIMQNVTGPLFAGLGIAGFEKYASNHSGGVVGTGTGALKTVDPRVFIGAQRHHTGGLAGLSANEVPTILERGEEVLTKNDPRHRYNQQGGSVKVELVKNGSPIDVQQPQVGFDAEGMVVKVILDDYRRGGPIRNTIGGGG